MKPSWRSILFMPACRPDYYPKALATRVDAICVDLEDGVASSAKGESRQSALDLLTKKEPTQADLILRINNPKTDLGKADIKIFQSASVRPDVIMLPKVNSADEIEEVESTFCSTLSGIPLIAQIETAEGLSEVCRIVKASPRIVALFFGAIDLSADLGCNANWEPLLYARSQIVLAAALAGVIAIDSPFMDIRATDELENESHRARHLGFVGKAAIHPMQVKIIQEAFLPTAEEISWANKIVSAYKKNLGGVLLVDNKLIEKPVVRAALRTISIASIAEKRTTFDRKT